MLSGETGDESSDSDTWEKVVSNMVGRLIRWEIGERQWKTRMGLRGAAQVAGWEGVRDGVEMRIERRA